MVDAGVDSYNFEGHLNQVLKVTVSEVLSIAGWTRSSTGSIISRLLYDLGTHLHIVYTFKQYIVICAALPRRGINNFAMIRRI